MRLRKAVVCTFTLGSACVLGGCTPLEIGLATGAVGAGYVTMRNKGTPETPPPLDDPLSIWWYVGAGLAAIIGGSKALKKEDKNGPVKAV